MRYTTRREQVVRLLSEVDGPKSAAEVHALVRHDLPLSSLYRTLTVLNDADVLERSHGVEGVALFELAEWLRGHHHHLVCTECGAVEDVEMPASDEQVLSGVASRVARSRGFIARGHRLDVEGICSGCAS